MDINEQFSKYFKTEKQIKGLDEILVDGVPLWRLVRTRFRWKFLKHPYKTTKADFSVTELVFNNLYSIYGLSKILLFRKKIKHVFFPHPRLYWVNNKYMDRLSDPLIEYSDIKNDYIIFERHQNGTHRRPRMHADHVVYLDIVDSLMWILRPVLIHFIKIKYKDKIESLYSLLDSSLKLNDISFKDQFYSTFTEYLLFNLLMRPILRTLNPKIVYLAPRITYFHIIDFCKKHGIPAVELQHGVTVCETALYSGSYCERIDPDYFYVFGKDNISRLFYVPIERQINIGFPYKNYIEDIKLDHYNDNVCLVISDPEISELLINIICDLARTYKGHIFHIRCHPQESLSERSLKRIALLDNIQVVDNKLESFCALSQYQTVLGENSTVLYEAMSLHKKIGRLNYGGLRVIETDTVHGGVKINCIEDFGKFMDTSYDSSDDSIDIYSDFNKEALIQRQ